MPRTGKLVGLLVALQAESLERAQATVMTEDHEPVQIEITMEEARQLGAHFGRSVTLTGQLPEELGPAPVGMSAPTGEDVLGAALATARYVAASLPRPTTVAPGPTSPASAGGPGRSSAVRRLGRLPGVGRLA